MQIRTTDGYTISENCSLQYTLDKIHGLKQFDRHDVIIKYYKETHELKLQAYKFEFSAGVIMYGFTEDEMNTIISNADAYTEIENGIQNVIFDCRTEKVEIPI